MVSIVPPRPSGAAAIVEIPCVQAGIRSFRPFTNSLFIFWPDSPNLTDLPVAPCTARCRYA